MTRYEEVLRDIRATIARMRIEDCDKVAAIASQFRQSICTNGEYALLALALVGAELAAQEEADV